MRRIEAGIVGVGKIGLVHMEALRRLGYAGVRAVAVRNETRAKALCEFYGIPKYYLDYQDLLADPGIEVIHDCTPNREHFPINRDALRAGKPVLSEKPLTVDSRESEELVGLADGSGLPTAVNFVYRHYAAVQHLRGMIEDGELGEVRAVHGEYLQDWLLKETDFDWRVRSEIGGPSRALADIGSHWLDLAIFLTGRPIREINADTATFLPFRVEPDPAGKGEGQRVPVDTEDYGAALLRFEGGARGVFAVSQVSPGRKIGLTIQVDGSLASGRWSQDAPDRLWIGRRDRPNDDFVLHPSLLNRRGRSVHPYTGGPERWPDAQRNMIDSFYRTILDGEEPLHADFRAGHAVVRAVEAALESARTGRRVPVG
jgi:predicted dehydrogenase